MDQQRQNPLKTYFRQYKLYMKLPSGTSYYPPGAIQFTDNGEVGVMAMTGKDEIILKNPDALLNGEAIVEVISSCVPAVKNPKILLTNDIDALITAIRYATYDDKLETEIMCPSCSYNNNFKLDLQYALDNMTYLESEYVINLDTGLTIFIRPYNFPDLLKGLHSQFEQSKITKLLEKENISDEARLKLMGEVYKNMSVITYDLISNSIVKIVDESKDINVSDREFIREFLQNVDKKIVDEISELVTKINNIGVKKTFVAKCSECSHEWDHDIDFNPVNFS